MPDCVIATKIEIITKSYQTPDEAWRWISEGGQSYALHRASRETIGTTVQLDLREDAKFLLDAAVLSDLLKLYVEFLNVPITVGANPTPINNNPAPWLSESEAGTSRNALYTAWIEEHVNQCGYCINGWLLTAAEFVDRNPNPTDAQIKDALKDLICRCGTHGAALRAVKRATQQA